MKPTTISRAPARIMIIAVLAALLLAFPLLAVATGLDYYIGVLRRIVIFALLATSLNLVLGYGGLVALGHAGFVGVGAYTVVILAERGVTSAALFGWIATLKRDYDVEATDLTVIENADATLDARGTLGG